MSFGNLRRITVWLLVAVAVAGAARPGAAVAQQAKSAAPGFEHVHALAVAADGRTLWLGAHTGLFRSADGGRSWQPVKLSAKHSHLDVMTLVGDPRADRTLYVGTHDAGVFRTQDGGGRWEQMNTGIGGLDVHGLALEAKEPAKLHAAVRGQGEGIYRTTDAGGKWVRVDDGPAGEVKVLASVNISTGMGGIFLYAGTAEGLLRSPDCF
ncbi:MAG: WD40/YVTN/BNR-like repeat-containing protein [Candidatus Rokuibacteriota bacterium]